MSVVIQFGKIIDSPRQRAKCPKTVPCETLVFTFLTSHLWLLLLHGLHGQSLTWSFGCENLTPSRLLMRSKEGKFN